MGRRSNRERFGCWPTLWAYYGRMRFLDKNNLPLREDWYGNNAAICCSSCGKVFLVSQVLHRKGRSCPQCGLTHATVTRAEVQIEETGT